MFPLYRMFLFQFSIFEVDCAVFNLQYLFTGTVTDGEFTSLRTQGETRGLHIWQLIHDAREAVGRMSKKTLLEMLIPETGKIS